MTFDEVIPKNCKHQILRSMKINRHFSFYLNFNILSYLSYDNRYPLIFLWRNIFQCFFWDDSFVEILYKYSICCFLYIIFIPLFLFWTSHSSNFTASSSKTVQRNCTRTWISYETTKIVGNRSLRKETSTSELAWIQLKMSNHWSTPQPLVPSFFFFFFFPYITKSLFFSNRVKYFRIIKLLIRREIKLSQ